MTNNEALEMLKARLECVTNLISGANCSFCDDCSLCYAQGNLGQQKEYLNIAIKALEILNELNRFCMQDDMHLVTIARLKEIVQNSTAEVQDER